MDNYPKHLNPPLDEWGGIDKERFAEWWAKVSSSFPGVPEEVARHWLHEHWGLSPYRYLPSRAYGFTREIWEPENVGLLLSSWDDYDPEQKGCQEKGKELCTEKMIGGEIYHTAAYMTERAVFPTPVIVLDNNDDHHNALFPKEWPLPQGFVLIEGHRRTNIASYLARAGKMKQLDIWLMKKNPGS